MAAVKSSIGPAREVGDALIERVRTSDWLRAERDLDEFGYAIIARLLNVRECRSLAALYADARLFRSTVVMERHRFGVGEYRYFARPLPRLVEALRRELYAHVAPMANRWAGALGEDRRYPPSLNPLLDICRKSGQLRPTPLLLRYESGGYNCLHQDLYGEISFPLQFTFMLSDPRREFDGGEFLLVEQRPRAQSRGDAIALGQGDAIVFPNRYRPVRGARGCHRVNVRHGVSRVRRGTRTTLGIIFHDAK
ncbi:MAG: 2OG-Fe(II) oxygenase [Candidatus Binataceae bacterium]